MSIIQLSNIERSYFKTGQVLSDLSLTVKEGEVVGLIGRNGAGKTTLLQLLMGILRPQAGTVKVFGMDPVKNPVEVKQRIGYVAEDQILPGSLSPQELFAVYADLYPTWNMDLAKELANRFQLHPRKRVSTMSKGQARSLALLLAIAAQPELLILDEPAGGLDPAMRRDFLRTSIEHAAQSGTTILFSSHQMTDVERLASRVLLLHNMQISLDCETDTLVEDYAVATLSDEWEKGKLQSIPGFVQARYKDQKTSAVFKRQASELQSELNQNLGDGEAVVGALALEDLFIELVGEAY
jgi:ABC-2 type transport system ATP-binding protein